MKKRYLILALILLLVFNLDVLQAQNDERVPKIEVVGKDGEKFSLKVSDVTVDVKVVGSIAVTTIDIIFKNESDRVLEGELNFPLAEGQTVSRFAMDLNGKLREGVVVEKAKGRVAFEEVVRREIDPALLEQTVGNNFKARIYPIPAKGTKRIVMAYEEELPDSEDGLTYRLPLNYPDKLEKFSLNAVVYERNSAPDARNNDLPGVDFQKEGSGFATSVRMKNYIAKNQFEFMLPSDNNKSSVMIEERDGKTYFLLNLSPTAELLEKELPKKICLFFDISNSSANRDFDREADFIEQYFARLGNFELELIPFSNRILSSEKFNIRGGNADELIKKLRSFRSDGGTQLGLIDFYRYDCDEFLLFSDGISNFGAKEIILGRKPVICVNSNQSAEHSYLKYVASATGGQYINLLETEPTAAVEALLSVPYSFIRATGSGVDIAETYPSINTAVKGSFSLSGVMTGDEAEITLYFGFGSEVTHSEKVYLSKDKNLSGSGLIPRLWAQKKLAQLDMRYEDNKIQITELGKEFSIVTRNTSLIILDRVQDYIKHKIVPPNELKKEYFAVINKEKERIEKDSVRHIEYVLKMFEKYTKWWKTSYEFGDLHCTIVDSAGYPLQDFIVSLEGSSIMGSTDSNGNIEFSNISAGSHSVIVRSFTKIRSFKFKIVVIADSCSHYTFSVAPNTEKLTEVPELPGYSVIDTLSSSIYGILKGKVIDSVGQPIIGATIRVLGSSNGGYSKQGGIVNILNIPAGSYIIRVTHVDKVRVWFKRMISAGGVSTFLVEMEERAVDIDHVVVTSQKLVDHSSVGSSAVLSSDELAAPQESINAIVGLTAGVTNAGDSNPLVPERSSGGSGRATRRYASMSSNALAPSKSKKRRSPLSSSIKVKAYESDAPYIEKLKSSDKNEFEKIYFEFKKEYGNSPGFYIDAADIATEKEMPEVALRILSNIAEMKLEDHGLLRILAQRLKQIGEYKLAVAVFREVLKIREEEPQSYRDLALALAEIKEYIEAAHYMYKVVSTKWSGRFPEVELIALNELNNIYRKSEASLNPETHDLRLVGNMPLDLRVVLNWDTDNCDIDLWVIDPEGEKCFYSHPRTRIGGNMSRDFTGGYGPEIFRLKKAIAGKYKIKANFYGQRTQKMTGAITLQMTLYTGYGTDKEEKKEVTLRLNDEKEVIDVGEFVFGE